MTLGWYALAGRELNSTMIAAVLTIIGFSINDTIVIFDRIREDLKLGVRGTFRELINKALNQTLSRTIITSGTVFIATMALFIFGGGAINDFAFTFLVGIITGTYSSIYIASAFVLWWHKGERPRASTQVIMETTAERETLSSVARAVWPLISLVVVILSPFSLSLPSREESKITIKSKITRRECSTLAFRRTIRTIRRECLPKSRSRRCTGPDSSFAF
jgi:predicted RND superfamily exporter protein